MKEKNIIIKINDRYFYCDEGVVDSKNLDYYLDGNDEENISFLLEGGWVECKCFVR